MSNTSRVTTKGQVTIPQAIRDALHLLPHTEVEFAIKKGVVTLRKANSTPSSSRSRGSQLLEVMRGKATVNMTTEEIMSLTRK